MLTFQMEIHQLAHPTKESGDLKSPHHHAHYVTKYNSNTKKKNINQLFDKLQKTNQIFIQKC